MLSEAARRKHWAPADSRIGEESDSAPIHVDWLIDNGEAYESLIRALRDARESIWVSQLAFDADCKAYASEEGASEMDSPGDSLLDAIVATSGLHRVSVKILLNSTLLLDTRRPLLRSLARRKPGAELIEVRGISRFPQLLHAKMVIIDGGRAFLMGSPFVNGYWDTPSHMPVDHRRPRRELGGRPIHDVSVGVHGPVVHELAAIFARLWNGAGPRESADEARIGPSRSNRRAAAKCDVNVVTTEPGTGRDSADRGSLATLDALLDGIQRARSLIYIEHQYLSSRPVVEALRQALDREPALEMIFVLNQNPDVTAYRRWQNARLADTGLLEHPRVGVFALWSTSSRKGSRGAINQVFVHSKVVIVDDEWAMVGSANLDGASLDSYGDDFSGRLARRVFRDVRNFDVSVVFTARKSARGQNPIRDLRERLWSEHLGAGSFRRAERTSEAQLTVWRRQALRNVTLLSGCAQSDWVALGGSFVLPYSRSPHPRAQLADVGVQLPTDVDLAFDPGWLEISFSPNWIRNMFL